MCTCAILAGQGKTLSLSILKWSLLPLLNPPSLFNLSYFCFPHSSLPFLLRLSHHTLPLVLSRSPDVFIGHLAIGLNGSTLLFVLLPGRALACAVAVLGKATLTTALQLRLPSETAVTDIGCKTGGQDGQRETESDEHARFIYVFISHACLLIQLCITL